MIRNLLFDLVGVLMRFDTEGYYRAQGIGPGDANILRREVFRSLEWAMQDRGAISDDDAITSICVRVPARLHGAGVIADIADLCIRVGGAFQHRDRSQQLL